MCQLDRECRSDWKSFKRLFGTGVPVRIYVNTGRVFITIALTPGSRMARLDCRARWITIKPAITDR